MRPWIVLSLLMSASLACADRCESDRVPPLDRLTDGFRCETSHDGPNCWGLALASAGLIPAFRHATVDEIELWLKSPLCRPVARREPLHAGDLFAIRGAAGEELHAFVHLGPDRVLEKAGPSRNAGVRVTSAENAYLPYGVPDSCRQVASRARCPGTPHSIAFRCQPLAEYLQDHGSEVPERYRSADRALVAHEREIARHAVELDSRYTPSEARGLEERLRAMRRSIQKDRPEPRGPVAELLRNSLLRRIDSTTWQLKLVTAR